jgi:hypothetical protein
MHTISRAFLIFIAASLSSGAVADAEDAARIVAALDTQYQTAVERNDWQAMDRILHADFVLVLGNGTTQSREQLLESARNKAFVFEKQVEMPATQTVRLFGDDTATVTALLWLKGRRSADQTTFDRKLWFTDTYVRTSKGWKYAFGQASLPLPAE